MSTLRSQSLGGGRVHGGVKFYRGAAKAARAYVERDRSRADDYYLAEGTGVATRLVATPDGRRGGRARWTATPTSGGSPGIDVDTGAKKGRLRTDADGLRFVEVVVNGPKTWSLAAALHPEISDALDAAQDRAAVGDHRLGRRARHHPGRAAGPAGAGPGRAARGGGDPALHLPCRGPAPSPPPADQRPGVRRRGVAGLHSVGVRDSIEAINGIGHAAVVTDPEFRAVLAAHGYTLDPETSEIRQLAPYVGAFSARAAQIRRNIDRYEAAWRGEHPGRGARPDGCGRAGTGAPGRRPAPTRSSPRDGAELVARWNSELRDLGYHDPAGPVRLEGTRPGWVDRDAVADLVVSILGAQRSAWNAADIRGEVEVLLAQTGLVADRAARVELAEDITARAIDRCSRCWTATDVPEHVRVPDLAAGARGRGRPDHPPRPTREPSLRDGSGSAARGLVRVDPTQAAVVGALAGDGAPGGGRGCGRRREDHRPARHPASCWRSRGAGWWW